MYVRMQLTAFVAIFRQQSPQGEGLILSTIGQGMDESSWVLFPRKAVVDRRNTFMHVSSSP